MNETPALTIAAENRRLKADIKKLHAHAHAKHEHGWGQLLDALLNPEEGWDVDTFIEMDNEDTP